MAAWVDVVDPSLRDMTHSLAVARAWLFSQHHPFHLSQVWCQRPTDAKVFLYKPDHIYHIYIPMHDEGVLQSGLPRTQPQCVPFA